MASRGCPGIDLLKRDQLVYELQIRQQPVEGAVAELVARLRSAVQLPINITPEVIGELATALSGLVEGVENLEQTLKVLGEDQPSPKQLSRVRAQLVHFSNRVSDMENLSFDEGGRKEIKRVQQLVNQLQVNLSSLELGRDESGELGQNRDRLGRKGVQGIEETVAPGECAGEFAKLPNPLILLFKDVKEIHIERLTDVEDVLWLLVRLEQHAQAFNLNHYVILSLLYPLAKGGFRELISRAMAGKFSLAHVRQLVISERLTVGVRRQLECDHIWRIQHNDELLGVYIERVRNAASALLVDLTEEQLVAIVLQGMRAADKSQFVFRDRPASWEELREAVAAISAIPLSGKRCGQDQVQAVNMVQENTGTRMLRGRTEAERQRCFRCGKTGHFVRACPVPRSPRDSK